MIYDENYMILDEDDDFDYDSLLDEDYEDDYDENLLLEGEVILDEDEEVLLEGEVILDEDEEVLLESPITSASTVDTGASQKAIKKAKEAVAKKINSGSYRAYKSSDSALVEKAIKNKNLLKMAAMTIAGSAIGAATGFGISNAKNVRNDIGNSRKANAERNERRKDAKAAFKGKEFKQYQKNAMAEKDKRVKHTKPAFSGREFRKYQKKNGISRKEEYELILEEALDMYLEESFDYVLNEAKNPDGNHPFQKYASKKSAIAGGAGAVAGGASGAALAKKILSGMKYTVFTMDGLTILSLYSTSKEGEAKGKSVCYALATATDGSKLFMHKIGLKSK